MRGDGGDARARTHAFVGVATALALLLASACQLEPVVTVRGRVVLDEASRAFAPERSRTTGSAVGVRVIDVGYRGTLTTLGSAKLHEDGRFTVELPAERTHLVVEAFDDEGEVVAAALLEHSGNVGETVACAPLDARGSLEATLFPIMATRAEDAVDVNLADLRGRLSSVIVDALGEKKRAGVEISMDLRRLAEALLAAQEAEIRGYRAAGVELTQAELFALELPASRALSEALLAAEDEEHENADAARQAAYEAFHDALADVGEGLGLSATARARAESSAGLAFRLVIERRLRADESSRELIESALLAAASNEGRAYERATLSLFEGAREDRFRELANEIANDLRDALARATSRAEASAAFRSFSSRLVGEGTASGSLLESLLAQEDGALPALEAALLESAKATDAFEHALEDLAGRALMVPGDINVRTFAIEITRAFSAHHDALKRAAAGLPSSSTEDAERALALLVLARSAHRLGDGRQ